MCLFFSTVAAPSYDVGICTLLVWFLLVFLFLSTRGRGSLGLRRWRGAPVADLRSEVDKRQLCPSTSVGYFVNYKRLEGIAILVLFPGVLLVGVSSFRSRVGRLEIWFWSLCSVPSSSVHMSLILVVSVDSWSLNKHTTVGIRCLVSGGIIRVFGF